MFFIIRNYHSFESGKPREDPQTVVSIRMIAGSQ